MDKKILFGILISLGVLVTLFGFVMASSHYVLSEEAQGVVTSTGVRDLPEGTKIGGSPTNYILLTEEVTLQTTSGPETFSSGTRIDCDVDPGEPDPCDQS